MLGTEGLEVIMARQKDTTGGKRVINPKFSCGAVENGWILEMLEKNIQ